MSYVPYVSVFGSLMYAMACTRPYISHAVGVLSRYMSKLEKEDWTVIKGVFKYFCGTKDHSIYHQGRVGIDRVLYVHGFVDVDCVGDLDHRRLTSGYVLTYLKELSVG